MTPITAITWTVHEPGHDPLDPRPLLERFAAGLGTQGVVQPLLDRLVAWASAGQAQIRPDLRIKRLESTGDADFVDRTGTVTLTMEVEPIPGVAAGPVDDPLQLDAGHRGFF